MRLFIRITKRDATKEDRNRIEEKIEKALEEEPGVEVNVQTSD